MEELNCVEFRKGQYYLPDWAYVEGKKLKIDHSELANIICDKYKTIVRSDNKGNIIYLWNGKVYEKTNKVEMMCIIQDYIQGLINDLSVIENAEEQHRQVIKNALERCNQRIKESDISSVYNQIPHNPYTTKIKDMDLLDNDADHIVFNNGVLELSTLKLLPHNHKYCNTMLIPVDWKEDCNKTPPHFTKFINHLARYDSDQRTSLLEAIGIGISNINVGRKCKKSLFLVGDGNCGKSVFIELMRELVGADNFTSTHFSRLSERFAMSDLYGKRVAADTDCCFNKSGEISAFKQVSSGDPLKCEYKGETPYDFTFKGLYVVASNELPMFEGDKGDWVYNRMLLINCGESISEEQQDKDLLEHLCEEVESIVYIAVMALRGLIKRNYIFTVSDVSKKLMNQYKVHNDMYLSFLEECCIPITGMKQDSESVLKAGDMWEACRNYIEDNYGKTEVTKAKRAYFHKAILSKYGVKELKEVRGRTGNGKLFFKFTLAPEYIKYKPE